MNDLSNIVPVKTELQDLSEKIKKRRKLLRISQEDLASLSGVSVRYIYEIEKGIANPSIETLMTVLRVLGMSLKLVITGKNNDT